MLPNPNMAALVIGSRLTQDLLQLMATGGKFETRHDEGYVDNRPVCLDDAGWQDHYGHRHLDVDVERL